VTFKYIWEINTPKNKKDVFARYNMYNNLSSDAHVQTALLILMLHNYRQLLTSYATQGDADTPNWYKQLQVLY
jgi:hypothetical protein